MQYRVFPSNPCVCSSLRLPVAITRSLKLYIIFFVDPFVDSFTKHYSLSLYANLDLPSSKSTIYF